MGAGKTPEAWDEWTEAMRAKHGNGNGNGASLAIEAQRLLPTPTSRAAKHSTDDRGPGTPDDANLWSVAGRLLPTTTARDHKDHTNRREPHRPNDTDTLARALTQFGDYAAAIARWEPIIGRPAPPPTEPTGRNSQHRLSPRFTEWMMGLPEGWVTDVPNITRNEALKACGNGVVPQQAYAAIIDSLAAFTEDVAA